MIIKVLMSELYLNTQQMKLDKKTLILHIGILTTNTKIVSMECVSHHFQSH